MRHVCEIGDGISDGIKIYHPVNGRGPLLIEIGIKRGRNDIIQVNPEIESIAFPVLMTDLQNEVGSRTVRGTIGRMIRSALDSGHRQSVGFRYRGRVVM